MDNELLLLDLHSESPHPKHERLKSHFVNQLLAGRLNPGEVIPTEQHLVKVLRVARTTVRQAMASLENDGLIRRGRGKGTFVEEDALTKLRRGQEIFALVVPETRTGFYPSLLHGFAAASGDSHFQTMICNSDNDVMRQADIVLQLLEKEVGGVAIVPTSESPTPAYQVRQLQKRGIPVVFCHRRVDGIAAPLLAIPFRQVGELAGETLAEHGHRRAAFFTSLRSPYTMAYFEGFQRGLQRGGGEVPPELQYWAPTYVDDESDVASALETMFATTNPPSAIFATFDSLAEMVYLQLPRLGLRVPEDVSLVGFGGAWRGGPLTRRLTSVVVDEIATGRTAVSLLHEMRSGERRIDDNVEVVLDIGLCEGETLASLKQRA